MELWEGSLKKQSGVYHLESDTVRSDPGSPTYGLTLGKPLHTSRSTLATVRPEQSSPRAAVRNEVRPLSFNYFRARSPPGAWAY